MIPEPFNSIAKVVDKVTKPVAAYLRRRAIRKAVRAYLDNPTTETAEAMNKAGKE